MGDGEPGANEEDDDNEHQIHRLIYILLSLLWLCLRGVLEDDSQQFQELVGQCYLTDPDEDTAAKELQRDKNHKKYQARKAKDDKDTSTDGKDRTKQRAPNKNMFALAPLICTKNSPQSLSGLAGDEQKVALLVERLGLAADRRDGLAKRLVEAIKRFPFPQPPEESSTE